MGFFKSLTDKTSPELRYAVILFIATRAVLTPIGILARAAGERIIPADARFVSFLPQWLGIWGMWDSAHYLDIAGNWSRSASVLGWYPLYPLLVSVAGKMTGNLYVAGLIVSNVSLLAAAVLLFRIVRLDCDEKTAYRSVKYLFLFPSAFLLSAVLSESLALALVLATFYFAAKRRWLLSGICGYLLSLTRPEMVLAVVPLTYSYLRAKDFKPERMGWDSLTLALLPLGMLTFMGYAYSITGDPLGYFHYKQSLFNLGLSNPVTSIAGALVGGDIFYTFNALFASAVVLLLASQYRRIGFTYWLLAAVLVAAPLTYNSPTTLLAISRHILAVFPLYLILAQVSADRGIDEKAGWLLFFIQACLMAAWTSGSGMVV